MTILLALTAAVGWGTSDFVGGLAGRRTPALVSVAVSELLGLVLLAPWLIVRGTPPPADPDLLWAALAGVSVMAELGLVYAALTRGEAFLTAPIGSLGAAGAVVVGLLAGDRLSLAIGVGLLLALVGGGLSAWSSGSGAARPLRSIATCLGAATAVAVTLTTLHAAGRVDPAWATAVEHGSTGVVAGVLVLARPPAGGVASAHGVWRMPMMWLIAAAGVAGDFAYTASSRYGELSIASALSSLYPVATIGLATVVQGRRARAPQLVGVGVALAGAALLGAVAP